MIVNSFTQKHIPKVAIVLLSYNSKKLLKDFLPLIIKHSPQSPDYQIVVVDNASTDNTFEYLQSEFPAIDIIQLNVNKGFTNGYVESLAAIKAEYYVLISSDIEVTENYLQSPISLMDGDKSIAAVQPKIKAFHQKEMFEYAGAAGGFIDYLGYPFCRGRIYGEVEQDLGQFDNQTQEIFWASGACLFIRADLYHQAGGFDNDFFAHMEEIDLCWRLKNMGYKIVFTPQSTVYHMGGFIIKYGSPLKVYRNHRNNLLMILKNLPSNQVFFKFTYRLLLDALAFYKMLFDGEIKASIGVIKAHWNIFSNLNYWLKKRKSAQSLVKNPNHTGIFPKSIVYAHFVKGIKEFKDLNWKP